MAKDLKEKLQVTVEVDTVAVVGEAISTPQELQEFLRTLDLEVFEDWEFTMAGFDYYLEEMINQKDFTESFDSDKLRSIAVKLQRLRHKIIADLDHFKHDQ